MEPTESQKVIIEDDGNTVVLAAPGSGKTFVISEMIKRVIKKDDVLPYQGIIAISYTRKASENLKIRTLGDGTSQKNSFFGTIDSFCLKQVVEPFGCYIFGHPRKELTVVKIKDLPKEEYQKFEWIEKDHPDYCNIEKKQKEDLSSLFVSGQVILESLVLLAYHIILKSKACQNYFHARYKKVFIDEFQDADTYTNSLFLYLVKLGITGIAVGDVNQSIFGYAHKSSKYISDLKNNQYFTSYNLSENKRCAVPIINYSNRLLDAQAPLIATNENRVFFLKIEGAERDIASFIDNKLQKIKEKWTISENSKIAILVKNGDTQKIINNSLLTPHRVQETTNLDKDLNPRSQLYASLLRFYFDKSMPFMSVLDKYVDFDDLSDSNKKSLIGDSKIIRSIECGNYAEFHQPFKHIADIILSRIAEGDSISKLNEVIADANALKSYHPVNSNEIQLMTLHKSKGLEFDVVFHLNVCEWELPNRKIKNNDFNHPEYPNWHQDLDLHYVGITRARKVCFLVRGTKRTNRNGVLKNADDSEFLTLNNVDKLRKSYTCKQ